jgi:hypothetical protein
MTGNESSNSSDTRDVACRPGAGSILDACRGLQCRISSADLIARAAQLRGSALFDLVGFSIECPKSGFRPPPQVNFVNRSNNIACFPHGDLANGKKKALPALSQERVGTS